MIVLEIYPQTLWQPPPSDEDEEEEEDLKFSSRRNLGLSAALPAGYPEVASLIVAPLVTRDVPVEFHAALAVSLDEATTASEGREGVLDLVVALEQTAFSWLSAAVEADSAPQLREENEDHPVHLTDADNQPLEFTQSIFFSHHIRNPTKKELIRRWAFDLNLSGIYRVGWPGLILVEGLHADVMEYYSRLKRLRWAYFAYRGDERREAPSSSSVDSLRRLGPRGMREFVGMKEFIECATSLGAASLIEAGLRMKLHGGGAAEAS